MIKKGLAVLICISMFAFAGCNNKSTPGSDTGPDADGLIKTETKYIVTDTKMPGSILGYLPEDDKEVKAVIKLAKDFLKACYNRDYRTVKGDEEFKFYTDRFFEYSRFAPTRDATKEEHIQAYKDRIVQGFVESERVSVFNNISITNIWIVTTKDSCQINAQAEISITDGAGPSVERTVNLAILPVLVDGKWKIDGVSPNPARFSEFFGD